MVVVVTADIPGGTQEQAEAWTERTGGALASARGLIFQADLPTSGGWRVVSVWESETDFAEYFDRAVRPALPPDAPMPVIADVAHLIQPESR